MYRRYNIHVVFLLVVFLIATNSLLAQSEKYNYLQAGPDYRLSFPEDHAAHRNYKTEWWYFTGELEADDRLFGYQFTIFRRRVDTGPVNSGSWSTDQILTAHLAVSDFKKEKYYHDFFNSRLKPNLSAADTTVPGDISLRTVNLNIAENWSLKASSENFAFDFSLIPEKSPLIHGKDGFSRKGPDTGQANIYYSFTRMLTDGRLILDGEEFSIKGHTWFDHEFGSSQLADSQVGWDWLSLRLHDDKELMLFRLREDDGSISEESAFTFRKGAMTSTGHLKEFGSFEPKEGSESWTSPKTGARYPLNWVINSPKHDLNLIIEPVMNNQEMILRAGLVPSYWEGLVRARRPDGTIVGSGYLELTGYDDSMADAF